MLRTSGQAVIGLTATDERRESIGRRGGPACRIAQRPPAGSSGAALADRALQQNDRPSDEIALRERKADSLPTLLFNRFLQPDLDLDPLRVDPTLRLSMSDELRLPLPWIASARSLTGSGRGWRITTTKASSS